MKTKEIEYGQQLLVSYADNLARYFFAIPNKFQANINGKIVQVVVLHKANINFDGCKIDCASDLHFAYSNCVTELEKQLGDKLVLIENTPKPTQIMNLAKYMHSAGAAPHFKYLPTEFNSRTYGRSYTGASFNPKGIVIKATSSSDGENQILIKPAEGKVLPEKIINDIYYWANNAVPPTAPTPLPPTAPNGDPAYKDLTIVKSQPPTASRVKASLFVDKMLALGYEAYLSAGSRDDSWISDIVIQPMVDVAQEFRAFIKNGVIVRLQERPRNGDEGYEQLAKGPDVEADMEEYLKKELFVEIFNAVPTIVPNMNSVDIFITKEGEWGIFEYGMGYSPAAADMLWIGHHFKDYVSTELEKRYA